MADPFRKAVSGQPLRVPARTWNTFLDAARAHQARQRNVAGAPSAELRPGGIVPIRNDSEADRQRFDILGIDGPAFTPEENEDGFKNRVALKGVVPTLDDHQGRFAILLEPVKAGAFGLGCIDGISVVRVTGSNEGHGYADVYDGQAGSLATAYSGACRILWQEEGPWADPPGPETRLAIVRIGVAAEQVPQLQTQFGEVLARYNASGAPWTNFETDGYIAFVSVHPRTSNGGTWPGADEVTWLVKATESPDAEVGFKDIEVGDTIGYLLDDALEPVPGFPEDFFHGHITAHAGKDGALFDARQKIKGGPGIDVDDVTDPDEPKVSVDLADVPGLAFLGTGDAGQLAVKPDTDAGVDVTAQGVGVVPDEDHGTSVSAAGVAVDLAAAEPGLQFDGAGDLQAKPDPTRGIDVTVDGIGVKLADAGGLEFDGAGDLAVKPNEDRGVEVDADGVAVKVPASPNTRGVVLNSSGELVARVDTEVGIDVDDDGLKMKVNTDAGLGFNTSGELQVELAADKGLEFVGSVGDKDLAVKVAANEGLEIESGGGLGLAKPGPHAYTMPVMCSLYLDKNGRIMGWYEPDAEPPDYRHWYSPWGYPEP